MGKVKVVNVSAYGFQVACTFTLTTKRPHNTDFVLLAHSDTILHSSGGKDGVLSFSIVIIVIIYNDT